MEHLLCARLASPRTPEGFLFLFLEAVVGPRLWRCLLGKKSGASLPGAQSDPTAILSLLTPLDSWYPFLLLRGQSSPLQTVQPLAMYWELMRPYPKPWPLGVLQGLFEALGFSWFVL